MQPQPKSFEPSPLPPPSANPTGPLSHHHIIASSHHLNDVTKAMNNMYRYTRYVYDASRKYYLLGRDRMINELRARPDEIVIEVGCGTARNLIQMARLYPQAKFYGLDASEEMLKTAQESIDRAGLTDQIKIAHGFAQNFDPAAMFGIEPGSIHKIVFSYALSMIPPWQESLDHALTLIKPALPATPAGPAQVSGSVHIVDFGSQEGLPKWFRAFLFWWLDLFGVHFRPELPVYVRTLSSKNFKPVITTGLKGYYWLAEIRG